MLSLPTPAELQAALETLLFSWMNEREDFPFIPVWPLILDFWILILTSGSGVPTLHFYYVCPVCQLIKPVL